MSECVRHEKFIHRLLVLPLGHCGDAIAVKAKGTNLDGTNLVLVASEGGTGQGAFNCLLEGALGDKLVHFN